MVYTWGENGIWKDNDSVYERTVHKERCKILPMVDGVKEAMFKSFKVNKMVNNLNLWYSVVLSYKYRLWLVRHPTKLGVCLCFYYFSFFALILKLYFHFNFQTYWTKMSSKTSWVVLVWAECNTKFCGSLEIVLSRPVMELF